MWVIGLIYVCIVHVYAYIMTIAISILIFCNVHAGGTKSNIQEDIRYKDKRLQKGLNFTLVFIHVHNLHS